MRKKQRTYLIILLSILSFVVLNILFGSVAISFSDFKEILSGKGEETLKNILNQIRIPEILMAISVGMALSLSGLLMQTFFRNPLAGPSVLGLSSGAGLGVALVMMTGFFAAQSMTYGVAGLQILASLIGTGIVLIILIFLSRIVKDNASLLIIGLMVGYFASAVVGSLEIFADRMSLQRFVFWGMGSFSSVSWSQLWIVMTSVVTLVCSSLFMMKGLDVYLLGETYARSMGMNVKKWRIWIIVLAGLLTGIVTAFTGPIAFLGLAVPHMARIIFKSASHKVLIPASILLGALTALVCLLISKMPGTDFRLPINSVTSLIGAPVVIYLIFKQRKMRM